MCAPPSRVHVANPVYTKGNNLIAFFISPYGLFISLSIFMSLISVYLH